MKKIIILFIIMAFGAMFTAGTAKKAPKNTPPPTKKERATIKKFNEKNPATTTDNTVTIVKEGKETEVPVNKDWDENRLNPFREQTVNLIYSYEPETGDYTVTNIEPFVR